MLTLLKEFFLFLKQEKKWWLVPLVLVLVIIGSIVAFSSGSVLGPLIYPFI